MPATRVRNNGVRVQTSHVPLLSYSPELAEVLTEHSGSAIRYSRFLYDGPLPFVIAPNIQGLPQGVAPLAEVQSADIQDFLLDSTQGINHHQYSHFNRHEQAQLGVNARGERGQRYKFNHGLINVLITRYYARLGFYALSFRDSSLICPADRGARNNSLMQVLAFILTFNAQNQSLAALTFAEAVARDEVGVTNLLSGGTSVGQIHRLLRGKASKTRADIKLVKSILHYAAKKFGITIFYIHPRAQSDCKFADQFLPDGASSRSGGNPVYYIRHF